MTSPERVRSAKDVREEASDWLFLANSPGFSNEDRTRLDDWLSASEFHRAAYWRLEAAWTEAARLAALQPVARRGARLAKLFRPGVFKAAAAIVLVAIAGVAAYRYYMVPAVHIYATAVGGHRTLTLPDGTIIDLNTDTVVRIADDLSMRRVWLEKGEALFDVKHDAKRPFTVIAGTEKITDLGTRFIAHKSQGRLEVALFEGKAQLETLGRQDGARSTELSPGEVAVVTGGTMSVTTKTGRELNNELSCQKGLLVFDETTLADAIAEFNRYNAEKIVVRDPSLLKMRVNGTFPVHARRAFAEVARAVFGVRAEDKGDEIVISR